MRFGQVGEVAYGVRDGEASVAKIDLPSFRNALQAFDFAVTPKEPTPAPKEGEKK